MDSLSYKYNYDGSGNLLNNKLNHVRDQVNNGNYGVDIDDQSANNYIYDRIGNLKKDAAEGLDTIRWTVYGKIKKIDKGSGSDLEFGYDAAGNRTTKKLSGATDTITYYVRDAQGNVLAIYSKQGSDALKWNEQHLYGSSRIGIWHWDTTVPASPPNAQGTQRIEDSLRYGKRIYELSNHLGNVLSTISDKKIGNDSSGVVNYYIAEVLSQNDYYPFGMQIPGRSYSASSLKYRYGFNGKENDSEVKGEGNQYDYGFRIYDPRIGRFLSVDPLFKGYPWYTPYQFAGNKPINAMDLDGLEEWELSTAANQLKRNAEAKTPKTSQTNAKLVEQASLNNQPRLGPVDNSSYSQQRSQAYRQEYQKNKGYRGATMDPLAAGMIYPMSNALGQYSKGVVQHSYGIYQGIKEGDYWSTAKNTGLLALDVVPFIPFRGAGAANSAVSSSEEIFSMSIATRGFAEDFALTTKAYQGWQNANKVIQPNNPVFDLFDNLGNVADVTTTNAKTLSASQFYTKLNKLADLGGSYGNRTLQIYVKEGQYSAEQIGSLTQKLQSHIQLNELQKTSFNITAIK